MWTQFSPTKRKASLATGAAALAALVGSVFAQSPFYGQLASIVFSNPGELPPLSGLGGHALIWPCSSVSPVVLPHAADATGSNLANERPSHGFPWLHVDALRLTLPAETTPAEWTLGAGRGEYRAEGVRTVAVSDTAELSSAFQSMGYQIDDGEDATGALEVPRLIVTELPKDMADVDEPDFRKALFFEVMLPLVLQANEGILVERDRLIAIRARIEAGETMSDEERNWLDGIEADYGVANDDFGELLARVDVIPPSLALAQAAVESGWGTSRYALESNAIFGQYTTDADLSPEPAPGSRNSDYRIHAFGGLFEAVVSYARNLNTHPAYQGFRHLRAQERKAGGTPDGLALARTLQRYSSRGDDYIHDIRAVIRANELDALDDAALKGGEVTRVVPGNT